MTQVIYSIKYVKHYFDEEIEVCKCYLDSYFVPITGEQIVLNNKDSNCWSMYKVTAVNYESNLSFGLQTQIRVKIFVESV